MTSLADAIRAGANSGSLTVETMDGREARSWADVVEAASRLAESWGSAGVQPGAHVAILADQSFALAETLIALWLLSSAPVMLPPPKAGMDEATYAADLASRVAASDSCLVAVSEDIPDSLFRDVPVVRIGSAATAAPTGQIADWRSTTDTALLQFTSGSGGAPRPVMLSAANLLANFRAMRAALAATADDKFVSWLPLYHDMGLIGMFLSPLLLGADLVLMSPLQFLADPRRWIEAIGRSEATISCAPNAGYAIAARAIARCNADLSRWRVALNGAEPVSSSAVGRFVDAAARLGFEADAMCPVYGLAEATLAVSFSRLSEGARFLDVPPPQESARACWTGSGPLALLGPPVPGVAVRVVDPESRQVTSSIGEIEVRGPAVAAGYYTPDGVDSHRVVDGWLRTGDLGWLANGELVVCGRLKDIVIVGGVNYPAERIEAALEHVEGVRAGRIVAFSTTGGASERVCVLAEYAGSGPQPTIAEMRKQARARVGITLDTVTLVTPRSLPRTSSGKLVRSEARAMWQRGALAVVAEG